MRNAAADDDADDDADADDDVAAADDDGGGSPALFDLSSDSRTYFPFDPTTIDARWEPILQTNFNFASQPTLDQKSLLGLTF